MKNKKQQHNSPLRLALTPLAGVDLEAPSCRLCHSHLLGGLEKQCGVVERPWGRQRWAESPPVGLLGCALRHVMGVSNFSSLFIKGE